MTTFKDLRNLHTPDERKVHTATSNYRVSEYSKDLYSKRQTLLKDTIKQIQQSEAG